MNLEMLKGLRLLKNISCLANLFKDCFLYMKSKMCGLDKANSLEFQVWIAFLMSVVLCCLHSGVLLICEYHCSYFYSSKGSLKKHY